MKQLKQQQGFMNTKWMMYFFAPAGGIKVALIIFLYNQRVGFSVYGERCFNPFVGSNCNNGFVGSQ